MEATRAPQHRVEPDHGLRPPAPGPEAAALWVDRHLGPWVGDSAPPSARFRGGQSAADAALKAFDVRGYAAHRGTVWPRAARGGSMLSPWIRHGLLPLPRVWSAVEGGPPRDVSRFRNELLWQEYARHLYARVGADSRRSLRFEVATRGRANPEVASSQGMNCVERLRAELHEEGWLPNPARMWLASHWSVRGRGGWREGEDRFFQHLLDGSRAANRLGWQWTSGAQTGRVYAFERSQVERQAPGWCGTCERATHCPIEGAPDGPTPPPAAPSVPRLTQVVPEGESTVRRRPAGPAASVDAVWLTAESLGDADPALEAYPDRPAVFVFDARRLGGWRLSRKRLVFLVECLSDLATRREVELHVGDPVETLAGRRLAATTTPVPGWRAISKGLDLADVLPWPWLVPPHPGPVASFSAWRKVIDWPQTQSAQGVLRFDGAG